MGKYIPTIIQNADFLNELDLLISSLREYRDAIAHDDAETLRGLLRDGRIAKEETEK